MRNSIKINPARLSVGPIDQTAKEASHGSLFLAARLLAGDPDRAVRSRRRRQLLEVDPKTKVVQQDGSDFRTVNPLGLVPTLRTDDGAVLTENAAILQYVADRFPDAGIAAASARAQPPASVALLHRHRTAQGAVRAAARQDGAAGCEDLCA